MSKKLHEIINNTAILSHYTKKNNNFTTQQKIELFLEKIIKEEFTVAFAGHFSAGKSTLINTLIGEDILATSPIPTSANIVKVRRGDTSSAVIYRANKPPLHLTGKANLNQIRALSKDGDRVTRIEWEYPLQALPEGVTVMDTPGVDSTDDAHRLSTESALHLADVVFYVMDYNHVQSELNFQFTSELQKHQSEFYLVVNQLDKHQETELSMEDFKQSVQDAFDKWGVRPKNIFFTSLKPTYNGTNDVIALRDLVKNYLSNKEEVFEISCEETFEHLKAQHIEFLQMQIEEEKDAAKELLVEIDEDVSNKEVVSLERWGQQFDAERKHLLKGASTIPANVRESLGNYLESMQDNFKVGFLFTKGKTEEERQNRLNEAWNKVLEMFEKQYVVHMKNLMKDALQSVNKLTSEQHAAIQQINFHITEEILSNAIPKGALATGQALLNYSKVVSDELQRIVQDTSNEWKRQIEKQLANLTNEEKEQFASEQEKVTLKNAAIDKITIAEKEKVQFEKEMAFPPLPIQQKAQGWFADWKGSYEEKLLEIVEMDEELQTVEAKVQQEALESVVKEEEVLSVTHVLKKAEKTIEELSVISEYAPTLQFIREKMSRLNEKKSTIALFGAFSAGKSSFANALLGSRVLPVSPNPMTAAITSIHPITEEHSHETAVVFFKTSDELLSDIQEAYKREDIEVSSIEEALKLAKDMKHNAFIQSVATGYGEHLKHLGQSIKVDREMFEIYVAKEEKSSFVKKIDFYFDSEFTKKGITLVDTPGADSIHARHTDVTFDYIRNADAIIFVTYYNHAFAKADREFLIQLGRVKDLFELDKMFFIVNAIDLANSEEEKQSVQNYVSQELQKFGIRFPNVYGVSSLASLNDKVNDMPLNGEMKHFEKSFESFLQKELTQLTARDILDETNDVTNRFLSVVHQTEQNLLRKDARLKELDELEKSVLSRYANDSWFSTYFEEGKEEIGELLYYVQQRVFFRFGDFFKESFHPSLFANKPPKEALRIALKETMQSLRHDLEQELKVTNLRISNWVKRKLKERMVAEHSYWENEEMKIPSLYSINEPKLLIFEGPFTNRTPYEKVFSLYRGNQSFFEKNEKEKMKESLQQLAEHEADAYLTMQKQLLNEWLQAILQEELSSLHEMVEQSLLQTIRQEEDLLEKTEQLEIWKRIAKELK